MPDWNPAIILLRSQQGEESSEQRMRGQTLVKGDTVYVRYEEPDRGPTGGVTRTTVKISKDELKVIRHGEVEAEQSFRKGRSLPGFYRSPFTKFNLSTSTSRLETRMNGPYGTVSWEYDLFVHEELTGTFAISLSIQEEMKS